MRGSQLSAALRMATLAVTLIATYPAPQLILAQGSGKPLIEVGLAAGGSSENWGWGGHLALEQPPRGSPFGLRAELGAGRFGVGRGCPADASATCASGFAWVFSAGLLGSYRFRKSVVGPFLVGGPGLSYTLGSAHRSSGVRPTLEFGAGVASKALGGPIFVVQGRYVAHGVLADYVGELTLGLGVRF